ncbi:hypothetical protein I79_010015 [Cricetulus griseus]|uniref:Uncharacterized protein n=1 Tax=Cricetulus griseus TaxID=10029 RepID=G3HHB7_CRIGR|nr:hypothetical protein I79_010015 [Cricetulus griseus]
MSAKEARVYAEQGCSLKLSVRLQNDCGRRANWEKGPAGGGVPQRRTERLRAGVPFAQHRCWKPAARARLISFFFILGNSAFDSVAAR